MLISVDSTFGIAASCFGTAGKAPYAGNGYCLNAIGLYRQLRRRQRDR